jgi:hypothetical protein
MANAPLPGTGWREQKADLVLKETKIFLQMRLDGANHLIAQVAHIQLDVNFPVQIGHRVRPENADKRHCPAPDSYFEGDESSRGWFTSHFETYR